VKEEEIRPKEIFQQYLELSQQDAREFNDSNFQTVSCPGCGVGSSEERFEKNGFRYVRCLNCGSLYCSPRPSEDDLGNFYKTSKSSKYWSEVFFPAVAEIRREKLFRKKAKQVHAALKKKSFCPEDICDVGAGYGIFLEELNSFFPSANFFAIEPSPELAERCQAKGFETLQSVAEQANVWNERFDLVISSEVIEHVHSCDRFVDSIYRLIKPGGYCLITGLGYEGFDILTLQENSNSIFPPHHLNFLSIKGFTELLQRAGFTEVAIWTPGELDVDIVINSAVIDEFTRVLQSRGTEAISEFQSFLQKYCMSSHIWVLAGK
jgi:ubiquinone/menaquinone biosynthesis C-methylase UbiE/ribosomal protein S27E